ncbi:hypothetical protein DPMN_096548 [Dreissena polymorpha]|uniref:Uncharacterized protein n=1 Tax=Dreissena polymorpha TaxID=45954 RepID=A0A9D4R3W1_DREPO|nr:hypothetical protein DPMN_096548 [Dreissena polymorpha]
MQEFWFHFQNVLGGEPPNTQIAEGGHPLPHKPSSPLRCSMIIVDGKVRIPLFKILATGLVHHRRAPKYRARLMFER